MVPGLEPLVSVYGRAAQLDAAVKLESSGKADAQLLSSDPKKRHPSVGMSGRPVLTVEGASVALGYKKTSVAQVRVTHGRGCMTVNDQPYDQYLRDVSVRMHILHPFLRTDTLGQFDVIASVRGGGPSSKAQAMKHGIAKALMLLVEPRVKPKLEALTYRDPRMVERKKPGRKKARKGFAYVRR
jgi:small subunit ribosomal protein S9